MTRDSGTASLPSGPATGVRFRHSSGSAILGIVASQNRWFPVLAGHHATPPMRVNASEWNIHGGGRLVGRDG